ncbi:MAG: hypothetical protein CMO01_09825, partial [Thalassobius sp.]|nr:hypothetical protein [Thalassovita sp.]
MKKHEDKYCPRCKSQFECKVGSITLCQCSTVRLTNAERNYINMLYDDCLCANCMEELKVEYQNTLLK